MILTGFASVTDVEGPSREALREAAKEPTEKDFHAMALDQPALLEFLEMMRSADAGELMRRLLGAMLQELVDAEATAFIGAGPHQRTAAT